MSAHSRRKAQRKYKQRLLSERESYQPSISTPMSVEETSETASGSSGIRRGARGERECMQREFRLQYVPTTPTTLGNTTID